MNNEMEKMLREIKELVESVKDELDDIRKENVGLRQDVKMLLKLSNESYENINNVVESTSKMDMHVDFVENVFNVVKAPFAKVLRAVSLTDNSIKVLEIDPKQSRIKTLGGDTQAKV